MLSKLQGPFFAVGDKFMGDGDTAGICIPILVSSRLRRGHCSALLLRVKISAFFRGQLGLAGLVDVLQLEVRNRRMTDTSSYLLKAF